MKLTLDKRRQRNDCTFPIVFRISYNGKSRDISSGFTCKLSEWDSRNNLIKTSSDTLKVLNKRLHEKRLKYQEKLLGYERNQLKTDTDIQSIKNYLAGKISHKSTVEEFWLEEIQRLAEVKNFGNCRNYKSALGGISRVSSLNIDFTRIDFKWLVQLETELMSNGVKVNSVAVYMRTLRALYNKAINVGIVEGQHYPFRRYKIKSEATAPRIASIEELQQFFNYIPDNKTLRDAWNYGRLIFLLRGINFTDLALLTKDNLKHGRVIYKRAKTHKLYSVKILPLADEIIKSFEDNERETLLPILTNLEFHNSTKLNERIGQQRKNINKYLRHIGEQLRLSEKCTTYMFRYSHASACQKLGYSKELISYSLGHSFGLSVTNCYLEDYDLEVIDEMNKSVCEKVYYV